jgi:N4-(beta-N-acetylglucosaminyl)-L-asparaginase
LTLPLRLEIWPSPLGGGSTAAGAFTSRGGCGVYADDNAGAASATGDGDLMTNYCTSISIIHAMARGATPQDACLELLQHMIKTDAKNKDGQVAVLAINPYGEIGAACMNDRFHLKYALWQNGESQLLDSVKLI